MRNAENVMVKASDRLLSKGEIIIAIAESSLGSAVEHLKEVASENPPQADVSSAEAWVISAKEKIDAAIANADRVMAKVSGKRTVKALPTQVGSIALADTVKNGSAFASPPGAELPGSELAYTDTYQQTGAGKVDIVVGTWVLHGNAVPNSGNYRINPTLWVRKA